jgi:predicted ATPase
VLKRIIVKNFKSLQKVDVGFRPLTILSGLNGSGKSSLTQTLLLIRQSFHSGSLATGELTTNGDLVELGRIEELLSEGASEEAISFHLEGEQASLQLEFPANPMAASVRRTYDFAPQAAATGAIGALLSRGAQETPGRFNYLAADRLGATLYSPMHLDRARKLDLGRDGRFALHGIELHQRTLALPEGDPRRLGDAPALLGAQLEAWLQEISPGIRLSLESLRSADLIVGGYSFAAAGELRSKSYRATNVGFGVSHILPVLVAILAAPPGGLIFLDSPESHLHPRGQTKLGELCAHAARAGVQVIVETHSDHFMDGARIAVRHGAIPAKEVALHFFSRDGGCSTVTSLEVSSDGKLSEWPAGFFDQHRRNAVKLIQPTVEKR